MKHEEGEINLGTALITIVNARKRVNIIRALCDNGSQANLISEAAIVRMGIKDCKTLSPFIGVNGVKKRESC